MIFIYKYPLKIEDEQEVMMPESHELLHVGEQNGVLTLWAAVNTIFENSPKKIYIRGTGHNVEPIGEDFKHIGSVQMSNGLVWHVFH